MDPYFVPFLARLLMEGLDRRAKSCAAETGPQLPGTVYSLVPTARPSALTRPRGERDDGKEVRLSRHFGRPGPMG